jgi:hypothetical protein
LQGIKAAGAIRTSRGWGSVATGVHVEVEPFGTTNPSRPGRPSPKADLGIPANGAFVEFDAPADLVPTPGIGPRNTATIPTAPDQALPLEGLNPVFVKVRRHWWEFWRAIPE